MAFLFNYFASLMRCIFFCILCFLMGIVLWVISMGEREGYIWQVTLVIHSTLYSHHLFLPLMFKEDSPILYLLFSQEVSPMLHSVGLIPFHAHSLLVYYQTSDLYLKLLHLKLNSLGSDVAWCV